MEYFGLKLGQDFGNRAAHPYQKFRGVPPPPPPLPGFLVQGKAYKVRANYYPADVTVEMDHLEHLTGVAVFKNINCVLQSLNGTQLCSKT